MAVLNSVNATVLLRNDLAAEWTLKNPVLMRGEMGVEMDTGLLKIGNGALAFNSLPYLNVTPNQLEQKVDKSGGTITGALVLDYTPTQSNDAVSKGYVDNLIASAGLLKREVVTELPALVDNNTIYMIKDETSSGPDYYKEFLSIDGVLTQIGDTSVDLTGYAKTPTTFVPGNLLSISAAGELMDSGISALDISVGIATTTTIGGVLSSTDDNSISVDSVTGKMNLNRVSVNNLYVPDGDEFILYSGNATD